MNKEQILTRLKEEFPESEIEVIPDKNNTNHFILKVGGFIEYVTSSIGDLEESIEWMHWHDKRY